MTMRGIIAAGLMPALLLAGCVVRDEVVTLTVRPDGSADLVVFHASIRATEEGPKGEEALQQYAVAFDARTSGDFERITRAGGEVTEARWVRKDPPCATLIAASLPEAAVLERYGSTGEDDGEVRVRTRFTSDGPVRRLTTTLHLPDGFRPPDEEPRAPERIQADRANAFSETRVVVTRGRITGARGWTIAPDRRSALLAPDDITALLRDRPEPAELFIEWEIDDPS